MLRIVKFEAFTNESVGFVCVTTDSGASGCGPVSTYNAVTERSRRGRSVLARVTSSA